MNTDTPGRQGNTLWMQILYLPVTIFMTTVDILSKMMGGAQRAGTAPSQGQQVGIGTPTVPSISAVPSANAYTASSATAPQAGWSGQPNGNPTNKENSMSNDQDLSGDGIKTVVYSIFFTKRDLEAPLKGLTEDVVNYPTNAASYGGLMIAKFSAGEQFDRPERWKDYKYPEPDSPDKLKVSDIPDEDQRYITIDFKVVSRFVKGDADYERRQTIALEGIERNTKGLV